jgi:hemerythrin-like metal-binding protein
MELFVEWEDKYSVGIEKIDNQHKQLIEIINRLYYSRGNSPHAVLGETIQKLIEYTKIHFADEERLMRENNYPDYQAHKKRHEAFIEEVKKFNNEYQKVDDDLLEDYSLVTDVLFYLKSWLCGHILVVDKEYSAFLNKKEIE